MRWPKPARNVLLSYGLFGQDARGDELPQWVANKELRRAKIREAKKELELQAKGDDDSDKTLPPKSKVGFKRKYAGVPHPKDQYNFTDPESGIMKTKSGFEQRYNAQIVVDSDNQIIVSRGVTNSAADGGQLPKMLVQVKENFGRYPKEFSADAGYCSEENLKVIKRKRVKGYVATRGEKHLLKGTHQRKDSAVYQMWLNIRRGGRRSRYRLRKQVVEPVFGQIKQAMGFRSFLLRGMKKVSAEWSLVCTAHNLRKMAPAWG